MKLLMPFIRALLFVAQNAAALYCYELFGKSGSNLNPGIISSLFASSIIYSTILFYIIYKQKISCVHLLGMGLILASVTLIGIGGYRTISKNHNENSKIILDDFYLSIVMGLMVGFFLSMILVLAKILIGRYKMTPY